MKYILNLILGFIISTTSVSVMADEAEKNLKEEINKVQTQLDALVDRGGRYAYVQLAQKNGLSPFAVAVDEAQTIIMLEVPKSEEKATLSDKILKLREMLFLGAKNAKFVAGALFVQAKVPYQGDQVDGVAIEMEHKMGLSVLRFTPYDVDRDAQKISFKKPVDKIKPVVFFKQKDNKNNKS